MSKMIKEASQVKNISASYVCTCCKGRQKTAGGFHWAYYTSTDPVA